MQQDRYKFTTAKPRPARTWNCLMRCLHPLSATGMVEFSLKSPPGGRWMPPHLFPPVARRNGRFQRRLSYTARADTRDWRFVFLTVFFLLAPNAWTMTPRGNQLMGKRCTLTLVWRFVRVPVLGLSTELICPWRRKWGTGMNKKTLPKMSMSTHSDKDRVFIVGLFVIPCEVKKKWKKVTQYRAVELFEG